MQLKTLFSCLFLTTLPELLGASPAPAPAAPARVCTTSLTSYTAVTTTVISTKTPKAVTSIKFALSLSTRTSKLPQAVTTFSTTSTVFTTITQTAQTIEPSTQTVQSTSTTAPATSTMPRPAGFTPIQSVFPERKRAVSSNNKKLALQKAGAKAQAIAQKCTSTFTTTTTSVWTKTRTVVTTLPRNTVTVGFTITIYTTTTVLPAPASTTLSYSTTSTAVFTTTTTSTQVVATSTKTVYEQAGPTPTSYDLLCGPDNKVSTYEGLPVDLVVPLDGIRSERSFGVPTNYYDCCVACVTDSSCLGVKYQPGVDCLGIVSTGAPVCDGSDISGFFYSGQNNGLTYQVGNSPCGQLG